MLLNGAVVRQTSVYALAQTGEVPPSEFLPVNMYHDILAPARMLLPAKHGGAGMGDGVCNVVSDGTRDNPLDIRLEDDRGPLWAQTTDDDGVLDNLVSLLVRLVFALSGPGWTRIATANNVRDGYILLHWCV